MRTGNLDKKPILIEAPTWKRALAFLIDYLILDVFVLFSFNRLLEKLIPSADSLGSIMEILAGAESLNTGAILWVTSFMGIIMMLYFAVFESRYAQTPGKMIMKIFAVTINSDKKNLITMSLWQAIKRSISIAFIMNAPIVFLVDAVYALFNPKKQRLLEKLSDTQTLQVEFI